MTTTITQPSKAEAAEHIRKTYLPDLSDDLNDLKCFARWRSRQFNYRDDQIAEFDRLVDSVIEATSSILDASRGKTRESFEAGMQRAYKTLAEQAHASQTDHLRGQQLFEAIQILGKFKALNQNRGAKHRDRTPTTVEVAAIDLDRIARAITLYEAQYGALLTVRGATPERRAS